MGRTTKRRCDNWIQSFLDWTLPVSEAPESLLIWSALFCIAAVLKRRVRFSKEYLKQYDIYPTTYVLFVGPAGVVRKSTSAGYAQKLITGMNEDLVVTADGYVNLGPTSGSYQKILDKMSETIDGSMTVISGEFGNIVSTSPDEAFDFFSKMFDTDYTMTSYEHATRGSGSTVVLNPSFNLLGCTTPDWMAENTGYMAGGGFAARTVYIFEYSARQRALFYKDRGPSVEELNQLEEDLIHDLKIMGRLSGEAIPESQELADRMEAWYQGYIDQPAEKGTETFQARKHVHTLRTAMILSIAKRNDLIIREEDFDAALVLINDVEKKLGRGLAGIGRNPYSGFVYDVLDYIQGNEPLTRNKLLARFYVDLEPEEIAKILEILKVTEEISEDTTTGLIRVRK